MSQLAAGKDILAYCNKCKLTLSHTIIVMKDHNTVDKVICNTCKSTHSYKGPNAQTSRPGARKKVASGTRKTSSQKTEELQSKWLTDVNNSTQAPIKYSPKTKFEIGNLIDHPKFGTGIVEATLEADKIDILFKTGNKILIHNK